MKRREAYSIVHASTGKRFGPMLCCCGIVLLFFPTRIVPQRLEESVGVARAPLLVPLDVDVEPALQERLVAVHAEQRLARVRGEERNGNVNRQSRGTVGRTASGPHTAKTPQPPLHCSRASAAD